MVGDLATSKPQEKKRKTSMSITKAIVMVACATIALRQVKLLVEEYLSFPTSTLYVIKDAEKIRAPAFTICPKPTLRATFTKLGSSGIPGNAMLQEKFQNATIKLSDLILRAPGGVALHENRSTVNGETTYQLSKDKGHWSERVFFGQVMNDPLGGFYWKCFTLFLEEEIATGPMPCRSNSFVFDFGALSSALYQIEVYVHDAREEYTTLKLVHPEMVFIYNNTVSNLFIRPEVIQKQSKWEYPCSQEEGYSYTRCMENCFWETIQSDQDLPCLNPCVMTKEANLSKPKCEELRTEIKQLEMLRGAYRGDAAWTKSCNCPKRCNVTDYHIFVDPTDACKREYYDDIKAGTSFLSFSFPSKRVPHFLEKEKVTLLDLLSNIGGIVGVCLGVSLITLFEAIELLCSRIRCKLLPRGNAVIDDAKH